MDTQILKSVEDDSVNFIFSGGFPGVFEARYVRRDPRYFAVYLSSQSGCRQGCRMCHLTATKQVSDVPASPDTYVDQAAAVLEYYTKNCPSAEIVHFNFMARGEAFSNELFLLYGEAVLQRLGYEAKKLKLIPRFLVSTIMPKSLAKESLSGIFPVIHPEIYYSIYSVRDEFRKKWLPNAMPFRDALNMLRIYQENTKKIIKLHWAFIAGENDSEEDVVMMCHEIRASGVRVDIAIVRYNPYGPEYGQETPEWVIDHRAKTMQMYLPFSKIKKITRVGPDVKASCGMFVEPNFKTQS